MRNPVPRRIVRVPALAAAVSCMAFAPAGQAGDGRIEISQRQMPYLITNSGSYVVTEPLSVQDTTNGITVYADDVTLDLNGFSLVGPSSRPSLNGIHQPQQYRGLSVRDGFLTGWQEGYGLYAGGKAALIRNVHTKQCGMGIRAGSGSVVVNCSGFSNVVYAVSAGEGSVLASCSASYNDSHGFLVSAGVMGACIAWNNGSNGLSAAEGSVVRKSVSTQNRGEGLLASDSVVADTHLAGNHRNGLGLIGACVLRESLIRDNQQAGVNQLPGLGDYAYGSLFADNLVLGNGSDGISAWNGSAVLDCHVGNNADAGIRIFEAFTLAAHNLCRENGTGIEVDGMSPASGRGNRIEDNTLIGNATGLDVQSVTNLIVQNYATANTNANWNVDPGNLYHQISNVTNGWPWTNLEY